MATLHHVAGQLIRIVQDARLRCSGGKLRHHLNRNTCAVLHQHWPCACHQLRLRAGAFARNAINFHHGTADRNIHQRAPHGGRAKPGAHLQSAAAERVAERIQRIGIHRAEDESVGIQ
jgi:hypothetical protein